MGNVYRDIKEIIEGSDTVEDTVYSISATSGISTLEAANVLNSTAADLLYIQTASALRPLMKSDMITMRDDISAYNDYLLKLFQIPQPKADELWGQDKPKKGNEEAYLTRLTNHVFTSFLSNNRSLVLDIRYTPAKFPTNFGTKEFMYPKWDGTEMPDGCMIPTWIWDESDEAALLDYACLGNVDAAYRKSGHTGGLGECCTLKPSYCAPSQLWRSLKDDAETNSKKAFPILIFTRDAYISYWPPLNAGLGASLLFEKPMTTLSGPAPNFPDQIDLERYPRAVIIFEYVEDIDENNNAYTIMIPIVKYLLGDMMYAYPDSDWSVTLLGSPAPYYWPRTSADKLLRPCPWASDAFTATATFQDGDLCPVSTFTFPCNACGLNDIKYSIDQQVYGSSLFELPAGKKYGFPSCKNGADDPCLSIISAVKDFNLMDEEAIREYLYMEGSTWNGFPVPVVTTENSSWLQGGTSLGSRLVNRDANDFAEITTTAAMSSFYLNWVSKSTMPVYLVDTTKPKLSITTGSGTVSWHPITAVYGNVGTSVSLSCDDFDTDGNTRLDGSYMAAKDYDLSGRKGLFDLAVIILQQYKYYKDAGQDPIVPAVPTLLASLYQTERVQAKGKTLAEVFDSLLANPETNWTGGPTDNPALFRMRHRLSDLDQLRLLGARTSSWGFQSIKVNDFDSLRWLETTYRILKDVKNYLTENTWRGVATRHVTAITNLANSSGATWIDNFDVACQVMWPVTIISTDPYCCQRDIYTPARLVGDWSLVPARVSTTIATQVTFALNKGMNAILPESCDVASGSRFAKGSSNLVTNNKWAELTKEDVIPKVVNNALQVLRGNFGKHVCIPMAKLRDPTDPQYVKAYGVWKQQLKGVAHWATEGLGSAESKSSQLAIIQSGNEFRLKADHATADELFKVFVCLVEYTFKTTLGKEVSYGYDYEKFLSGETREAAIDKSKLTNQRFPLTAGMVRHWIPRCRRLGMPYDLIPDAANLVTQPLNQGQVFSPVLNAGTSLIYASYAKRLNDGALDLNPCILGAGSSYPLRSDMFSMLYSTGVAVFSVTHGTEVREFEAVIKNFTFASEDGTDLGDPMDSSSRIRGTAYDACGKFPLLRLTLDASADTKQLITDNLGYNVPSGTNSTKRLGLMAWPEATSATGVLVRVFITDRIAQEQTISSKKDALLTNKWFSNELFQLYFASSVFRFTLSAPNETIKSASGSGVNITLELHASKGLVGLAVSQGYIRLNGTPFAWSPLVTVVSFTGTTIQGTLPSGTDANSISQAILLSYQNPGYEFHAGQGCRRSRPFFECRAQPPDRRMKRAVHAGTISDQQPVLDDEGEPLAVHVVNQPRRAGLSPRLLEEVVQEVAPL